MSMSDTNKRANESLEGPLVAVSSPQQLPEVNDRCPTESSHRVYKIFHSLKDW